MTSDDTKLEVLNDHYKDTFAYIREYIGIRDRFVFYILITISLLLFQAFSPEVMSKILADLLTENYKLTVPLNVNFIGSAIWFLLLALSTKYFQTVVYIEGQYLYLHKLEDELSKNYENFVFTREGKSYLKRFEYFSKWVHFVYRVVFPVLLITAVIIRLWGEFIQPDKNIWIMLINCTIAVCIMITTLLYEATIISLENKK